MSKFEISYIITGIILGLLCSFGGNIFVQFSAFLSLIAIYFLRTIIEAQFFTVG